MRRRGMRRFGHLPNKQTGPFHYGFVSADRPEPPHTHITCGDGEAKIWLGDLTVAWSRGLKASELRAARRFVKENLKEIRDMWDAYFGKI